jgi:hypothetical protein
MICADDDCFARYRDRRAELVVSRCVVGGELLLKRPNAAVADKNISRAGI